MKCSMLPKDSVSAGFVDAPLAVEATFAVLATCGLTSIKFLRSPLNPLGLSYTGISVIARNEFQIRSFLTHTQIYYLDCFH